MTMPKHIAAQMKRMRNSVRFVGGSLMASVYRECYFDISDFSARLAQTISLSLRANMHFPA